MNQRSRGRDPDSLIIRSGVRGDPRYDQHFLIDERVLNRLVGYADVFNLDHVLEIGTGPGALTDRLLKHAKHVTTIERDRLLATFIRDEFEQEIQTEQLRVVQGDVLDIELPDYTVCVSNIPYGISSEILFRLLPEKKPFVSTLQREVAERIVAKPGTSEYGRLSVTAQYYSTIEIVEIVPPTAFEPAPPVESAIIRSIPRTNEPRLDDPTFFLDFVTALFTQRRKTTRNAIRNTTHMTGITTPGKIIESVHPSVLDARPGELTQRDFVRLARLASKYRDR